MQLEIIENSKNRLMIKVIGEDHTLCNAIKDELNKDNEVLVATYKIDHPLTGVPVMLIETKKGREATKALIDAAGRVKKNIQKIESSFDKKGK